MTRQGKSLLNTKSLSSHHSKNLHLKNVSSSPLIKNLLGVLLVTMVTLLATVSGHGYMLEPPSRASAFRVPGYESWPTNYDDNQMYCGGRVVSIYLNPFTAVMTSNDVLREVVPVCL